MEDDDGVEGFKLGADGTQVQANDDGVEDDTELQDEESGYLLLKGPLGGLRVLLGCVILITFAAELLLVGLLRFGVGVSMRGVDLAGNGFLHVGVIVEAVLDLHVALGAEVEQEDGHDRHEHDGRAPGVIGPVARHAYARLGSDFGIGWVEQMDKGGGDDDAGAKVAGEEVHI